MSESLAKWDERHRAAGGELAPPTGILRELLPLLPPGSALELACGTGRNAIFLAEQGWRVTALDGSRAALEKLRTFAEGRGVATTGFVQSGPPNAQGLIEILECDLEQGSLPVRSYNLIVCIQYLQRSLFSRLERMLRAGGMLLMETLTKAQLQFEGGPRNPAYLLESGELRNAFPELETVFYRELRAGQGIASLLARKTR